jgi:hypothetical protein
MIVVMLTKPFFYGILYCNIMAYDETYGKVIAKNKSSKAGNFSFAVFFYGII